ncbi:MAG: tetratricopeptide repeat protein [Sandaracinaceae bacterium]
MGPRPKIAVVGDEDGELARALGRLGLDVTPASAHGLHVLAVEHIVLLGPSAIDGGAAALERAPKNARVHVVLPESAAAARLAAVRLGATVVPACEGIDDLSRAIVEGLDGGSDRLGWLELGSFLDAVGERLAERTGAPGSRRVRMDLGSGERVLGAVERFVDEIAKETAAAKDASREGPRVAVDQLTWDDDPQTLERRPSSPGVAIPVLGVVPTPDAPVRLPSGVLPAPPSSGARALGTFDPDLDETAPRDALAVERELMEELTLPPDALVEEPEPAEPPPPPPPPPNAALTRPVAAVPEREPSGPQRYAPVTAPPAPAVVTPASASSAESSSGVTWALVGLVAVILVGAMGVAAWIALSEIEPEPYATALASVQPSASSSPEPAVPATTVATAQEAAPNAAVALPTSDQTANGATADGVTANGVTADGATADGVTANGVTADGATADGATADGVTADAVTADAVTAGGAADGTATDESGDPRERSDALVAEGEAAERSGDWRAARAAFEAAIALYDANPHAVAGLARERMAAGDPSGALERAERAVQLRRRRPEYHVLLGDARSMAGDRQGAERAYRRALELDPDNREALRRVPGAAP